MKNRKARDRRMLLEQLDRRELMAADLRSFDGTENNLSNPQWGSTEERFLRVAAAEYGDGIASPAGSDRMSARAISNIIAAQGDSGLVNDRDLSAMAYAWGQFLDHDIDLTNTSDKHELFSIAVPKGDPYFDPNQTGVKTIPLERSNYDLATGLSKTNPRQQINSITSLIDGSQVYGSSKAVADSLRTFQGGKMKTSPGNLLPYSTATGPASSSDSANHQFAAGDVRANENPGLVSLQTLFVREHNRIADAILKENPKLSDEQIYQRARKIVIGELQAITYNEFLPALLGKNAISPYRGYDPKVNPGISNEFSTAAFRFGHSMLGGDVEFLANDGSEVRDPLELRDAFFRTESIEDAGIDPVLKYLASDQAHEIDTRVIDDVRNFLFGPPGSGGLDLAALNIQRGRDHGLADYNATRVAFGLRPVKSFSDITSNAALQQSLKQIYGNVDNIDLWVGGLAEDHAQGSSVGPTFQRIMVDQFQRLRDGDRFWYQRDLQGRDLAEVQRSSLADVIRRNTSTINLQANVFFFQTEIVGRITVDLVGPGQAPSGGPMGRPGMNGPTRTNQAHGLGNITVELLDAQGVVVATTKTDRAGNYRFEDVGLGRFRVRVVPPTGMTLLAGYPGEIAITKGGTWDHIDFRLRS